LAKARLLLLQEEGDHEDMIQAQPVVEEEKPNIRLRDELENELEEPSASSVPMEIDEQDPLEAYLADIEKQAVPQEGTVFLKNTEENGQVLSLEELEDNQEGLDDDEYYQRFIQAFKPKHNAEPEPKDKPEILYEEDEVTAWDSLLNDEENEDFLSRVRFIQQRKAQEKRELPSVNHAEINYDTFRKDLYIESPELAKLEPEKIKELREELGNIQVRGKRCPAPILNWYQCGLSDKVLRTLEKKKFKGPFAIQAQAIPAIMSGRDVIGIAETGSGKTLAYLLPMFRHIMDQRPLENGEGPLTLVLAPTRELAYQIFTECKVRTI
jgi:ATP-dependent RNA helicase DDX46/PRP5